MAIPSDRDRRVWLTVGPLDKVGADREGSSPVVLAWKRRGAAEVECSLHRSTVDGRTFIHSERLRDDIARWHRGLDSWLFPKTYRLMPEGGRPCD